MCLLILLTPIFSNIIDDTDNRHMYELLKDSKDNRINAVDTIYNVDINQRWTYYLYS